MTDLIIFKNKMTSPSIHHGEGNGTPTPVFLPGESQGQGEPGGLLSMGLHRVGHGRSDLAAVEAAEVFYRPKRE